MKVISKRKQDEFYQALLDRDSQYVGIFYVGVLTTSIFCIATCRARKPKRENVLFFHSYAAALKEGFRPCKICCPTEKSHPIPEDIQNAIQMVKSDLKTKVADWMLREAEISPEKVRRWFKKNYGITFHTFQRMYRINNAFIELKEGKAMANAAYDAGYESLSGFGYTYKKLMGGSPAESTNQRVILISRLTTPLGPMITCSTKEGICLLEFSDRKMLETEFKDLQRLLNAPIIVGENNHTHQLQSELKEYFNGIRMHFDVALDIPGTDFQKSVWKSLLEIPYGRTSSYSEQAKRLGRPEAIRAMARANGYNRISIVVPCHRVIGKDGSLTGYGGGIERKKWLLDFEKSNMSHLNSSI